MCLFGFFEVNLSKIREFYLIFWNYISRLFVYWFGLSCSIQSKYYDSCNCSMSRFSSGFP